jgi:hypothetical protein
VHGLQLYAIPTSTSWIPFTCKSSKWMHKMPETQLNHHPIKAARSLPVCQLRHKKLACMLHVCNGNQPPIQQQAWIRSIRPRIVCMNLVHTSCLHVMKRCVIFLAAQLQGSLSRAVCCGKLDRELGCCVRRAPCYPKQNIRKLHQAIVFLV